MENVPTTNGCNLDKNILTEMDNVATIGNSQDSFQESMARSARQGTEMYQQTNDSNVRVCEDVKPQFLVVNGEGLQMDLTSTSTPCNNADLSNSQYSGIYVENITHKNGNGAGSADDDIAGDSMAEIKLDIFRGVYGVYDYEESSAVRMHSKKESEMDVDVFLRKETNKTEFGKLHTTVDPDPEIDINCIKIEVVKEEMSGITFLVDQYMNEVNDNQNHEEVFCETETQVKRRSMRLRKDDCAILPFHQANGIHKSHCDEMEKNKKSRGKNHSCSRCGIVFKSQALLTKHKFACPFTSLRKSDNAFCCPICLVYCSTKPTLKRHLVRKHPNMDSFCCSFCKIIICPIQDFLEHLHYHHTRNKVMDNQPSMISPPLSEFICVECNKNVRNQQLLLIHTLAHKINKSLWNISQNSNENDNNNEASSLLDMDLLNSDEGHSTLGINSSQSDVSFVPSSLLRDSFESVSPELISTINRSLYVITFLLQRLHAELKWTDRTGPKSTKDLIKKFKALSRMSSGITEVANCLVLLLTKQDQASGYNIQSQIKESKIEDDQQKVDNGDDYVEKINVDELEDDKDGANDEMENLNDIDDDMEKIDVDDKDNDSIQLQSQITKENGNNDRQCNVNDSDIIEGKSGTEQKVLENEEINNLGDINHEHNDDDVIEGRDVSDQKVVEDHEELKNLDDTDQDDDNYIPYSVIDKVVHTERRISTRVKRKSDRKKVDNNKCADFICESTLDTHKVKRVHASVKPYACNICSNKFRLKNLRQRHYKVHCIEGKFECNSCDYKVKTITAFLKHLANNRDHHANTNTNTKVMCIDLPSVTSQIKDENQSDNESMVKEDKGVRGNNDLLNDKIIDEDTKEIFDHTQHVSSHRNKEVENSEYVDGENKDLFYDRNTDETDSKIAEKSVTSVKKKSILKKGFACNICDAVFAQYTSYCQHKLNHRFESLHKFQCPVCPISYNRRDNLKRHLIKHCKKDDDYKCDCCDFISKNKFVFELHFQGHDSERSYNRSGDRNQSCNESKLKEDQGDGVESHAKKDVKKKLSSKEEFVCGECGMVTKHSACYHRHMQSHLDEKPFKCILCPKSFIRRYHLKNHMIVHYKKGNEYKCEQCDFTTKNGSVMKVHLYDHERKRLFTCDTCSHKLKASDEQGDGQKICEEHADNEKEGIDYDKSEISTGSYKKSLYQKKGKRGPARLKVNCRECGKEFVHPNSCKAMKTEERSYQCPVCEKCFNRNEHLKKHILTHKIEDKYKCDHCDFSNNKKIDMVKHIIHYHNPDKSHSCDVCEFKTRTTYELEEHKKIHEPKECKYCSYLAKSYSDLMVHARIAHMQIACPHCDYICYYNRQLRSHLHTHDKERTKDLVSCELCNYSCTKKGMKYHMVRHSNSKPLTCPDCDYRCSSYSSMANHKNMHKGIRPYLCSFCGASFSRPGHLKNHLLVHMKDSKKHACEICGRKFRARHNLRVHEMIHTGEKRRKCHLCPFTCRRNRELARHLRTHGINTTEKEDKESVDDSQRGNHSTTS